MYVLVALAVGPAHAAEPGAAPVGEVEASYPSSPPIGIDDAETVERGHAEINLTAGVSGGPGGWEAETPLLDANLGVTDNIHVNAEIPFVVAGDGAGVASGLGRGAFAVKVRVFHRDRAQVALHPSIELPPIPAGSVERAGAISVRLPAVVDVALGERGAGAGFQVARTFTGSAGADQWDAAAGFATPLGPGGVLMFDYTQEASANLVLGEGWFEVGYVHEALFGSEHLALLASLGRSTQGGSAAMVGVQVGI